MLFDNYIIVNKKDLCIFTPFINIEYDLKKDFLDFIQNKQKKDEIYIPITNIKKNNKELFEFYENKKHKIWDQFRVDMLRCKFYINNRRIINPKIAKQKIINNYKSIQVANKVALLCTQGALAFIIKDLQFSILNENYYVSEHEFKNKKLRIMKVYVDFNKNNIIIKKSLRIINITKEGDDKTIKHINLIIEFIKNKNNEFNSIVRIEL